VITLYTKTPCPYCEQAKVWLKRNNIEYQTVDINSNRAAKDFLVSSGHKTVPQIYVGTRLLVEGGFEGLSKQTPQQLRENIDAIAKELQ
jgi:glutaredoxin